MTAATNQARQWTAATRARIRELQDCLVSTAEWARESGADAARTELLLQPYRDLMETLYERDVPLAKLADDSDLLLHVRGAAATGPSPRVSVLTRLLTSTRDEVTRLAMQFAGVTTVRVPPSLDMAFVGVAGGSLFIGFSAEAEGGEITRQAVNAIANASWLVSENRTIEDIAESIDDPAARDMAVGAVRHLSPSGQIGIREIEILGRQVPKPTSLTVETRRVARGMMTQRLVETSEPVTFVGTVRELDLDASRFEIRNVDGQADDVRCAHELEEDLVRSLLNKRVRVKGKAEYGARKTVRLLWIDELEPLE
jgi:hypothetical protein